MTWPVAGPVADMLSRSLEGGRMAHSYLFLGAEGSGQVETANYFAKAILCESKGARPCETCIQCRRFESGNHPDLIVIEPDGNAIKIAQMRELQKAFALKSMESVSKVYIIHQADKMTVEAANSLLKFLEEPSTPVVAVLLAEAKNKLLPTIISRCQVLQFPRRPVEVVQEQLQGEGISASRARFLAYVKQSLGAAKEFAGEERFAEILTLVLQLTEEIAARRNNALFTLQEKVFKQNWQGHEIDAMLDCLSWWYRDVLYVRLGMEAQIAAEAHLERYRQQAMKSSPERLLSMIDTILNTKKRLQSNANVQLSLEHLVLQLQEG
ncbi:DNA polymerase III subunit delta' [Tumebacillus algifaecis]|uniref:DNA polymerase III subunit delta' n=1 Tax=Tumebacillus algifaecis TaxID=1214604 RepID=A0A223CWG0_9BACL|nr:DNA polymerase III subunit delta' [Tumebacillus algifaecis]ASS73524.1 DNA polymerase III subunit delta' [Tumebacillus algifaecis]